MKTKVAKGFLWLWALTILSVFIYFFVVHTKVVLEALGIIGTIFFLFVAPMIALDHLNSEDN